ncbi:hypothetical protein FACS1894166_12340 [Bacilli bacterium]|nr:hypothetical protein FACS1894166_12340 [Bacilli bacterium]
MTVDRLVLAKAPPDSFLGSKTEFSKLTLTNLTQLAKAFAPIVTILLKVTSFKS